MNKKIRKFQEEHFNGWMGQAISFGNTKLPKTTAIFNMCSATECPSAELGLCSVADICYARKDEKLYKGCLPKNTAMAQFFDNATPEEVAELIGLYVETKKKTPITELRISEAGDFKNPEAVEKMDKACGILEQKYGLNCYVYTCRADIDFSNVKHMQVNASREDIKGAYRYFKAVPKDVFHALPKNVLKCVGNDPGCGGCEFCYNPKTKGMTIYCKEH